MADIAITRGVLVYRIWPDTGADLLALFQYSTDAEDFAKAVVCDQPGTCFLFAVNTFDGRAEVFRKPADAKDPAK